jgi:threonine dehydrogenase-like Zn-dependent dehydrogenase
MRAVVMRQRTLVVDDVPDPKPRAGEVLVRTLACGICGSDLHALSHGEHLVEATRRSGGPFVMDLGRDVVMGHEFCAELLDHGPGTARTLKPGTRVCSLPFTLGSGGIEAVGYSNDNPGGFGELMRLTEAVLLPVPNGLSTEHAALTEPMAVGLHAVEKARLERDDVPLVVGCGPVGLAVIAALALRGAGPIVAADFSAGRRELASAMGAHVVIDPAANSPYERWAEVAPYEDPSQAPPPASPFFTGPPLRSAVIFECVGVPGVIDQIVRGAPAAARVVVVGVCMEPDHLEPIFAINKELNIQFALGYSPEEFAATLRHIAEGELAIEPLITGKVGIDGVAGAFEALASPERHAKILVEPGRT